MLDHLSEHFLSLIVSCPVNEIVNTSFCHTVMISIIQISVTMQYLITYRTCILQAIWRHYNESCSSASERSAAYTAFCDYWRTLLPEIIIAKPRSDLCWTCQKNSNAIIKAMNRSETEKSKVRT